MSLKEYKAKRNFNKTLEPAGKTLKGKNSKMFVVQKHHASHLHYDFRLELDGVLKSWAIPKGPSLNPNDKRLAVEVEDHPVDYASFEGEIPEGEYGGGHVIVWDKGEWIPPKDVHEQLKKGRLEFELHGHKLAGEWLLIRTHFPGKTKKNNWLLIKRDDESANAKKNILEEDESVLTGVSLEVLEKDMNKKSPSKTKFLTYADIGGPELATLVDTPPVGENWIHEIKYDGYRTLCFKDKKTTKLLTRSGLDWSKKYLNLKKECEAIAADSIIFDGEVVWLDNKGRSSFQELQNSLEKKEDSELVYCAFDLLYLNGHDTRNLSLIDRKKLLKEVLEQSSSEKILFSEHWDESGKSVFESACENNLEGIISKNSESHYSSGRNKSWLKIKCTNVQEFIITGYTVQENKNSLGALLMGAYNQEGDLQYIGRVGTGLNAKMNKILLSKLKKLQTKKSNIDEKIPKGVGIIWVRPELVANIEFGAWTDQKILRHAAFKGLREDKEPKEVFLEESAPKKIKSSLSHPDKILYPEDKITKQDLADYYESIEKWIMPHLKNRPLALLRCPNGEGKKCFFQKHVETDGEGILSESVISKLKKKKEDLIYINSKRGLLELVQLGTLEIHNRGCLVDEIDYPNQIVFDFDPDLGVKFESVKEAAFELKAMLEKLKLKSFIKVSGGKGLHVHVPIAPIYDWDQIKNFSKSVCNQMVNENSKKFTTNILKSKRKGKIFLDYLRNGYGASAIAPYSVRAHPHAPVALPISWIEAKKLNKADSYTLKDVLKLLKKRKDPWIRYQKLKQKIKLLDKLM